MDTNQANKLYHKLVTKSWEDQAFKSQLLNEPAQTIENELGRPLRLNNRHLIVEDQTNDGIIFFNIPKEPNFEDIELSEHQLELIAGGENVKPVMLNPSSGLTGI